MNDATPLPINGNRTVKVTVRLEEYLHSWALVTEVNGMTGVAAFGPIESLGLIKQIMQKPVNALEVPHAK
jgi:hypothetical protein